MDRHHLAHWVAGRAAVSIVATLALGALAACSDGDDGDAASATTEATAATTAPAVSTPATVAGGEAPMAASVEISNFSFIPAEVHVAVGGTVTWTNNDDQQHTATSSGTFDAGAIQPSASASATFDTAGTVAYICSFHPFMKATIVVG